MILHFLLDEKIAEQIISNFEGISSDNKYLVFVKEKEKFKHIKNSHQNILIFKYEKENINGIVEKLKPTGIVLHAYHLEFAKILLELKYELKIAWVAWGFDIYGLPKIKQNIYAPLTDKFLSRKEAFLFFKRKLLANNLLRTIFFLFTKEQDRYSIVFKSLKKVNYFSTYLEEDYIYFSKYYPNNLRFVNCTFTSIDQYLAGNEDVYNQVEATNIIIGNSNTPESNHLDVIDKLKHKKLASSKVFVPLSYGQNDAYRKTVIKEGESCFGDRFEPLLIFMERQQYLNILMSCSVGIFYHYRQQAMGNIIAMLYLGARVYMYAKSPVYLYLKRNQINVFDFDTDFDIYNIKKLPQTEVVANRKILETLFNKDKVNNDLSNLIKLLS
jgi:dTDP-N-acetylfucosamine:lipid II N-acetylfucosaminyltransferase